MKLGQLKEYNKMKILVQKLLENEVGRVVPDLCLFFNMLNLR